MLGYFRAPRIGGRGPSPGKSALFIAFSVAVHRAGAGILRPSRPCLRISLPWFSVKGLNVCDGICVFALTHLAASTECVG